MPFAIPLAIGLGGSLLGGFASQQSQTKKNQQQSQSTPTYSQDQYGMQSTLAGTLSQLLQGSAAPQIQALQSQSANQINDEYAGVGDRMNRFLSQRGFGKSGQVGQAALRTELGRQSALANNSSNFAGMGLNEMNTALSDSMRFAFANPGQSYSGNSTQTQGSPTSGLLSGLAQWLGAGTPGLKLPGGGSGGGGWSSVDPSTGGEGVWE